MKLILAQETTRRLLAWAAIVSSFWGYGIMFLLVEWFNERPIEPGWGALAATGLCLWGVYALLFPKHHVRFDKLRQSATVRSEGQADRVISFGELGPLEIFQDWSGAQGKERTSYVVRSATHPEIVFATRVLEHRAVRKGQGIAQKLGLSLSSETVISDDDDAENGIEYESETTITPSKRAGYITGVVILILGSAIVYFASSPAIACQKSESVDCEFRVKTFRNIPIWKRAMTNVQSAYVSSGMEQFMVVTETSQYLLARLPAEGFQDGVDELKAFLKQGGDNFTYSEKLSVGGSVAGWTIFFIGLAQIFTCPFMNTKSFTVPGRK
ncbi:MAG: hypothetical protein OER96_04760 [Gammaproteobacteria bacterium]|nr:hypothetical protein [Gammaproteobacteria bacterium]